MIDGLSSHEVAARRKKYGYNELPNKDKKNIFKIIFGLVSEPMISLLLLTVIIYFIIGDRNEALILSLSFFGIIAIELYQDRKTEKSLEALKNLSSPICEVIRDGRKHIIPGRELVVGDIILLSEGSRVPADAKLISAENLKVDESLLTGESLAVDKHTQNVTDYKINSVFSGTLIVKGHGTAEVTGTGKYSEIGKIGSSLKSISTEKTLLQKEVNKAIKIVAALAISASFVLFLVYWIQRGDFARGILAGLTLSIAILPEEFPVVLTIFLTLGAWRLAKSNVLARRAHAIETLGSASVLCVDKTGTLTENKMEIVEIVNEKGELLTVAAESAEIIRYGVLGSQKNPYDPMDEAFIVAGKKIFSDINLIYKDQTIVKEYSLEYDNLSVVNIWKKGPHIESVGAKGAPEAIFELCKIPKSKRDKLDVIVKEMAGRGYRILAIAKADVPKTVPQKRTDMNYTFLGLVGLVDPIRSEVVGAVKTCHEAGIRVVMITGDYPETAKHIAEKIGLDVRHIITGPEFEELSNVEKREVIKNVSVFSRVSPQNKLTIVNAFKTAGEVVAMTGDGVNDAPALKSAHVGVAMGKKGTDVAREAAGIVLQDDNFASIVSGVRLGRRIYDNLQKAMSYIIAVHIPIAFLSLMPVLFDWPLALVPIHIVFLEFLIDPSCTILFENEKESKDIMSRRPRKLSEPIFSKKMVIGSILNGIVVALIVVLSFKFLLDLGWTQDKARGLTFIILVVANLCLIFALSGKQAIANIVRRENVAMISILLITSISLLLIFSFPMLRELFHFGALSYTEALTGILVGSLSAVIVYVEKFIYKKVKGA